MTTLFFVDATNRWMDQMNIEQAHTESNTIKAQNGVVNKKTIQALLSDLLMKKVILHFKTGIHLVHYDEEGEFTELKYYLPFILTLNNKKRIGLFTSNSIRSDRIDVNAWDAYGAKFRTKPSDKIQKAIFVFSPEGKEANEIYGFDRYKQQNGIERQWYIDEFLTDDELENYLKNESK